MVHTRRLEQEIYARGMTPKEVAWHLGMSERCFGRKLETGKFGADEMLDMAVLLKLQCPEEIFFARI